MTAPSRSNPPTRSATRPSHCSGNHQTLRAPASRCHGLVRSGRRRSREARPSAESAGGPRARGGPGLGAMKLHFFLQHFLKASGQRRSSASGDQPLFGQQTHRHRPPSQPPSEPSEKSSILRSQIGSRDINGPCTALALVLRVEAIDVHPGIGAIPTMTLHLALLRGVVQAQTTRFTISFNSIDSVAAIQR
jgi:hypothetical protein